MFKRIVGALALLTMISIGPLITSAHSSLAAPTCTSTGFYRDGLNLTAAVMNPFGTVNGDVDATGCNIGVYYNSAVRHGTIDGASIHGANYFGVVNDGTDVSVRNSSIHDIGENPLNGDQHGVGVYFAYGQPNTGSITGTTIWNYQKGGIVVNGGSVAISDNTVNGQGPVPYIAQNGIQIGYGATGSVMSNTVTGNSYTGLSTVSGGIIVVGGPYYGSPYTTNVRIDSNTVTGNDVGVFLTNVAADGSAPATATNIKVVNNVINDGAVTNGYVYQAGVSDVGNNDKIVNNTISGAGYDPSSVPGSTFYIDASALYTNRAKVHANSLG